MDRITIDSAAYKEVVERLKRIEHYVIEASQSSENLDKMWVDSYAVCQYLQISERTLQRLRSKGEIAYSVLGGKIYYTLGAIKHALESRTIKRSEEQFAELRAHYEKIRRSVKK